MPISNEKMTFLTANYGLTSEQVQAFADAYQSAYYQIGADIEDCWSEGGFYPEDPEGAMIEAICDADRLSDYIPDYMDWCYDFAFKQELAHDIQEVRMPQWNLDYLKKKGMSCWMLQ